MFKRKIYKSFEYFTKKYPVKTTERFVISPRNLEIRSDLIFLLVYMTYCL